MENKSYKCLKCGCNLVIADEYMWCPNCNTHFELSNDTHTGKSNDYKNRNNTLTEKPKSSGGFLELRNPGKLIKTIGKVFYCLMVLAALILSIVIGLNENFSYTVIVFMGIFLMPGAIVAGFPIYLGIYAFGSLVENVQNIAEKKH